MLNMQTIKTLFLFLNIILVGVFNSMAASPVDMPAVKESPAATTSEDKPAPTLGRIFGVTGEATDVSYNVIDLSDHTPGHAAWRSALLPGWGQRFNTQEVKGALITGTFLVTALGSISLYNKATSTYDDYKEHGVKDDSRYDDYERRRTGALVLGTAALFLWAYSVRDAYKTAANPTWSENPSVRFSLLPDGGEVSVRRKFGSPN
jgi:Family of unknown function (DUF5683)